jgi:hypothetical protein
LSQALRFLRQDARFCVWMRTPFDVGKNFLQNPHDGIADGFGTDYGGLRVNRRVRTTPGAVSPVALNFTR